MSVFTPAEIAYMRTQRLGRIASVGPDGQPHVVPVGFRYNPEQDTIDVGGHGDIKQRKYYRDLVRNPKVAFVIDDLASVDPWTVRGIEIRGEVELLPAGGQTVVPSFGPDLIRIHPRRLHSWGLDPNTTAYSARPATEQAAGQR